MPPVIAPRARPVIGGSAKTNQERLPALADLWHYPFASSVALCGDLTMSSSDWMPSIVPKDDDRFVNPTSSPKKPDLQQVAMAARLEQAIARAYQQRAQERARVDDTARHPSDDRQAAVVIPGDPPSHGRPSLHIIFGLLLVGCIGVAAIAWLSYGDEFKQMINRQPSQSVQSSSRSLELQPSPPTVQADAANAATPQSALQAKTGDVPTRATAFSPGFAQLPQTVARDIAAMGQEIEQLKANQEQMARDNAKIAEQLKASQEQMAANASKQNMRPGRSAPPPQPITTPTLERAVILGALTDNKGPMTPSELAFATGRPNRNVRRLLNKMAKSGEILKLGRGRYGLQPTPGNNDNSVKNGLVPVLRAPQAAPEPQAEQELSSPPLPLR